ncbi:hypothetical protein C8D88_11058 [Lentzea atacamensis]|uniref:Uncharacterized protein n=1 Tax=Lentzea atacamensis TaxID=531938 RepID=A0A316HZG8_9PSEU|nr:hypothetical protein [Lentzea atacamensis]PWK83602.1 hypothetical protein C8D88_11058 [Lentzea atacamensis]
MFDVVHGFVEQTADCSISTASASSPTEVALNGMQLLSKRACTRRS